MLYDKIIFVVFIRIVMHNNDNIVYYIIDSMSFVHEKDMFYVSKIDKYFERGILIYQNQYAIIC